MTILLTGGTINPLKSTYEKMLACYGHTVNVCYPGNPAPNPAEYAGLMLTGGVDIDPIRFGAAPLPNGSETFDLPRDEHEFALISAFMAARKPLWGICRGMQVLNIALGGDIWQDLPSQRGLSHAAPEDAPPMAHNISWEDGCRETVNSYHHQAVRRLGAGLRAAARSNDGVIEAVAHSGYPLRGVQWHPELMPGNAMDWLLGGL